MTTIQAVSNTPSTTTTNDRTAINASAVEIEHRFLTLLVSQMKNQDPLNPLDNAQLTTQLAQISTVSGIDRLNDTMTSIAQLLATKPASEPAPAPAPAKQSSI